MGKRNKKSRDSCKPAKSVSSCAIEVTPFEKLVPLLSFIDKLHEGFYVFDRKQVLRKIVTQFHKFFECEATTLFLVDENDPRYIVMEAYHADRARGQWPRKERLRIQSKKGEGFTGHVANVGKIVRMHGDALQNNPYVKNKRSDFLPSKRCISILAIPLKDRKGRLIGLLNNHNKRNAQGKADKNIGFSLSDQQVAELLADKVVVLLENNRIFGVFHHFSKDIQSTHNLEETLATIKTRAKTLLRADRINIALWSRAKGELVMERGGGQYKPKSRTRNWCSVPEQTVIYSVWRRSMRIEKEKLTESNDDAYLIGDVRKTESNCRFHARTRSILAILLRASGKRIGVLSLESFKVKGFDTLDQWTLRMFAQNVSVAIQGIGERAWLQDELDFQLEPQLPSEESLNAILDNALELYGLDAGLIYLADYEHEILKCVAYRDSKKVNRDYHGFNYRFQEKAGVTNIFDSRKPLFSAEVWRDSTLSKKGLEFFKIKGSLAGWPLVFEGVVVGVLVVWNRDNPGPTEDHVERLWPFARLAAAHIARSQAVNKGDINEQVMTEINLIGRDSVVGKDGFLEARYLRLIWIGIQAAGFERARVYQHDQEKNLFVCQASYGTKNPNEYQGVTFKVDSSPYAMDLKRNIYRSTARIYDPTNPMFFGPSPHARKLGKPLDMPWAVVPIVVGASLRGQIAADNAYSKNPITKDSIQILTDLGGLISQILLQRQQAETDKALKESQDLYQSLVKNIPVVMWRKDLNFRFTYLNGLFCNTIGKKEEDIKGKTDYDLFPSEYADRFRYGDEQIIKNKKEKYEDDSEPFPLPNEEVHYIHVIKKPVYDIHGKIAGTQGMFLDVTNETFRQLFEQAPIGFHEIDEQGCFTHVNRTEQDMLGIEFKGMQSKPLWNFVPKDERDTVKQIVLDLLKGKSKTQQAHALNLLTKDNTMIPVIVNNRVLQDSEGRITGMLSAVEEISAGIDIERALREPDPRYLANIKELRFPVFCKDRKTKKFTFVNKALLDEDGYSNQEDVIGKTDIDLFGLELGRKYQQDDLRVTKHGEVLEKIELHTPSKGKQPVVVHVIKFPILNSRDEITGLQGMFWNFERNAEAKSALNEALESAKEEYRNIVNGAVEGIFQSTLDGKLLTVNPALVSMLGYGSAEELLSVGSIGRDIYANPQEREKFIQKMCECGAVQGMEYAVRRKDGTEIWLSKSARAIKDNDGNIKYLAGFVQDITQRKQDEDLIKQALKEKEEFLREMQHRVINILLNIEGLVRIGRKKLISKGETEGVAEEVLQETEERIEAMKLVHSGLLKAEDHREIPMRDFIDKLTENLVQSYKRKTLKIERSVKIGDVTMGSTAAQACALIINDLISNSMKHAFPGRASGRIAITLKRILKRGEYSLVVSDNGIGLPENINVKTAKTTGLRLVNAFVKTLRGKLQINRTGGTKFIITFNMK